MTEQFERVYVVWNSHDCPRSGLADFEGRPHYFVCEFDSALDDYGDVFHLYPVPPQMLAMALEQHEIWQRYWVRLREAGHPGPGFQTIQEHVEASKMPNPAGEPRWEFGCAPEDSARYRELKEAMAGRLAALTNAGGALPVFARFKYHAPGGTRSDYDCTVKWVPQDSSRS